ncbi:MAG TPA: malto-oligosyltrehalose synthase [Ensifer sp.]|uniref:malto-oligosyltrehalose synthase n=1 Tax=Ensifer sp. TaxID=1872086 RepID=UPI002E14574C|nr:malto-oligosyltrehalose synthase [Ensifer sp.]
MLSTYRLQFHHGFPFSAGQAVAGYLARLGVTHVYASPILAARSGSKHGYDVISYDEINPELGGAEGFRAMSQALRSQGLGLVLDIVPNHVAVGGDDNAMWLDLLKRGRSSRYARWFDIDFDERDPVLGNRIHVPFLGEPFQDALEQGKLTLVDDPARRGFAVRYGEHLFPLREEDDEEIRAAQQGAYRDHEKLRPLIERQHYHLDYWRNASDRLNWRRFFEITQLAGIRIEEPEAFDAAHRIAFSLYEGGWIDGLRIDHVDGLADPAAYCATLRARLDALSPSRPDWATPGPAWLIVEKILAPGETIPANWGVDGTTGYDFMDQVNGVLHDGRSEPTLASLWSEISGRSASFVDEEQAARREVLEHGFEGQLEQVVDLLMALATATGREVDIPRGAMRRATSALCCQMRSYRTYATGRNESDDPGPFFIAALEAAHSQPQAEQLALDFINVAIAGAEAALPTDLRRTAVQRFNQLTSPLAARSVEDTAFYRYGRLLSRNDVGFDAARFSLSVPEFHATMQERAVAQPRAMLALATHDHKRGADVRARLAVISENAVSWGVAVESWFEQNAAIRPEGLDRSDEYQFYQTLVGTWPAGGLEAARNYADRLSGWWLKALREAKLKTGWISPNQPYEQAAEQFLRAALDRTRSFAFLAALDEFVNGIAPAAALNGIVQLILQCTAPGVPDTYQGTEFWDLSMVDPDNRRPVNFSHREQALEKLADESALLPHWQDGRIKQNLLHLLLQARLHRPELFVGGAYRPLRVTGSRQDDILAFVREARDKVLVVVLPLRCSDALTPELMLPADWWRDTHIALPGGEFFFEAIVGAEMNGREVVPGEGSADIPWRVSIGRL